MVLAVQLVSIGVTFGLACYVVFQLRSIHVLVNSRLSEALDEIKRLGGESNRF